MPHDYSKSQISNIQSEKPAPILLCQLNHSGTVEYLSASGAITYDGQAYAPGGFNLVNLKDSASSAIQIAPTAARVTQIINKTYKNGIYKLIYIPAISTDSTTFAAAAGKLIFDGIIDISVFGNEYVTVQGYNKYLRGNLSPGYVFNQFCNHIPPAGSTLTWGSETVAFEPVQDSGSTTRDPFYLW